WERLLRKSQSPGQFYPSTRRTLKFQFSRVQSRTPPLVATHQRTPIRAQYPIDELQISSPSRSSLRSTTTYLGLVSISSYCPLLKTAYLNGPAIDQK
ncbi:hypothetical protein CORC01_12686, partial [Colletotrichum orchidophilum]